MLLRGEPALVDRSNRGVVAVTGPDRLTWLHSLLSQHLESLPPGEPRQALLLSPHGHVEQHLVVVDDGETTYLQTEPGQAPAVVAYLDSMRFMLRVEVTDVTSSLAVLTVAPEGRDLLVPRADLDRVVDEQERPLAGMAAFEALRVAARTPRFGVETDHRTIPHELGWIGPAVHLDKGCYRGQETVARVENLGRPPRRLVLVHFDGSREQLPPPGTPVTVAGDPDGRAVGFLGTSAWHAELGPIGLAVVKRQTPDDARLVADGMALAIDPG